jgi:hypothetical protein
MSSVECVGQEKEFVMRLTNRERGEHCSSTSPSYSFSFSTLVFLLTYVERRGKSRRRRCRRRDVWAHARWTKEYVVEEKKKNRWWWLKESSREREDQRAYVENIYYFFSDNKYYERAAIRIHRFRFKIERQQ